MTVNIFAFADTWNAIGTTFDADKINISNGAGGAPVAAAGSRVFRRQANGVDVFGIGIDGVVYTPKVTTGNIFVIDPVVADSGAKPFYWAYNKGSIPSGGTKNNAKFVFGYNISPAEGIIDNTDVTQYISFNTVTGFASGTHVGNFIIGADSVDGKRHAMYSMEIPHDSAQVALFQGRMEFYTLAFQNVDGTQYCNFVWDPAAPKITLFKPGSVGTTIQFDYNNAAAMSQLNAAGNSTIPLPFINAGNDLQINTALQVAIADLNADIGLATFAASVAIPNGGKGIYVSATAAAAAAVDVWFSSIDSTGKTAFVHRNLGGGDCAYEAWCATSGGDPWTKYNINGGGIFGVGIDNSDSDAFIISANNGLGTNNRLRIDANVVGFPTLPIKVPSFTVATLPNAATVGAGSLAYASDAAVAPCLAISNGTVWKRSDNAATTVV